MTRAMVLVTVTLLWASAHSLAASPPLPCAEAQRVDSPCVGVLVPERQAAEALACIRADLPACVELAKLKAQDLEAELSAAKAHAEAERKRADRLSALLDEAVTPPPPRLAWWQSSEFAITITVVAAGALTAAIVLGVVR